MTISSTSEAIVSCLIVPSDLTFLPVEGAANGHVYARWTVNGKVSKVFAQGSPIFISFDPNQQGVKFFSQAGKLLVQSLGARSQGCGCSHWKLPS